MSTAQVASPARDARLEASLSVVAGGSAIGRPCYAFRELPSTMDLAHQLALQGAAEGTCVWAEQQTAGRGRAGRVWSSPPGGLYCSLILRPSRVLGEVPQLALVAGLAVIEAIHDLSKLPLSIRWPNDVLLDGQKLSGILTEAKSGTARRLHAVVGIGINVTTAPQDLPPGAISLAQRITPAPDRLALTGALFHRFERAYQQWNAAGFAAVRHALLPWIGLFGKLVTININQSTVHSPQSTVLEGGQIQGQAIDIDESGRLVIRLDSGVVRAVDAGEVSLLT